MSAVKFPLRLNMKRDTVRALHAALAAQGFAIDERETADGSFGPSTRAAVTEFQQKLGIQPTGEVDAATARSLNRLLGATPEKVHRVRGSLRDEHGEPIGRRTVRVYRKTLTGEELLGEKTTYDNGFYDIPFIPATKAQEPFSVVVKTFNEADEMVGTSSMLFDPPKVAWVNFNLGDRPYLGTSVYDELRRALDPALAGTAVTEVTETAENRQVSFLAKATGRTTNDVMTLLLAERMAAATELPPETWYAFVGQHLPGRLPGDLLEAAAADPAAFGTLVATAIDGIVAMDTELQRTALDKAFHDNLVRQTLRQDLDRILQQLGALRGVRAAESPFLVGKAPLAEVMAVAQVPEETQRTFIELLAANRTADEDFWKVVADNEGFDETAVAELRTTLDIGLVTKNHVPLLQHLKASVGGGNRFQSARDMAKLDQAQWVEVVKEAQTATGGNAIPPNLTHDDDADVVEVFASVLQERAEALFPTVAVTARAAPSLEHSDELMSFVDANPDFELRTTNIDGYMKTKPGTLVEGAVDEFKILQRTIRVTDKPTNAAALVEAGYTSAGRISSVPMQAFTETATSIGFTTAEAHRAYRSAAQLYGQTLARFGEFSPRFNEANPRAIVPTAAAPETIEDFGSLRTLFGSVDFCACEHCSSVLSPAAYLVDMLQFLDTKPAVAGGFALARLFVRRGDLGRIKLSCENTNTVLPYIDLVCEVLEEAIAPSATDFQTTLPSEQLRAHPEYVNKDAYVTLKSAKYPMVTPFDLWLTEARVYLQHLGIARHELQRLLQTGAGAPSAAAIAAERLGLSSLALGLITTPAPADQAVYWGTASIADLTVVSTFLARSGLEYDEMRQLLAAEWANPAGADHTELVRPINDCDVAKQTLTNLGADRLDRLHRMIRLQRATGIPYWELDRLLRANAVGASQLDGAAVRRLDVFLRVRDELNLPTDVLLAFYDDIDTTPRPDGDGTAPSLYRRLFLNPTVTNPTDSAFEPAAMAAAPTEPMAGHTATILAAVSITQADFDRLATKTDGALTPTNLGFVYRYASLARALKLPVADLVLLQDLMGIDPFASGESTRQFIENVRALRATGAPPAEVAYLLRHDPAAPIGWSDALIAQRLIALRAIQHAVHNEYAPAGDNVTPIVERGLQRFDAFADRGAVVTALRIVDGTWDTPHDGELGLTDAERIAFIQDHFPAVADPAVAVARLGALVNPPGAQREREVAERFEWMLAALGAHFSISAVKDQVATAFGMEGRTADVLLGTLELASDPGRKLLQHLLDPRLTATAVDGEFVHSIDRAEFPKLFDAVTLLHKASLLSRRLALTADEVQWVVEHAAPFGLLSPAALPVAPAQPTPSFAAWRDLARTAALVHGLPTPDTGGFLELLSMVESGAGEAEVRAALATLTRWSDPDLSSLSARLGLAFPAAWQDIATYLRLFDVFALVRRAGVSVDVLKGWADADITDVHAHQIKRAAKARYGNEQWLPISGAIQDDVRERKRAALVAHVLAHPPSPKIVDENDLYAHLLIDIEMSACQMTSRVKQAISSVQLYVQRCLLNLEREEVIAAPGHGWEQWRWMKNYRVWEANRKVFLYPENWIEPELRDDKSPLFVELENELLQDEITDANVERAMRGYLMKLDGISRLEVVGTYHHVEPGVDVLHVLGRTRDHPQVYYHRTFENGAHWTAWEKVDLEIDGSPQVLPVVLNRKLHLFWLTFQSALERQQPIPRTPPGPGASPSRAPDAPRYLEIKLAWTTLDNGRWTGKHFSDKKLIHPWLRPEFSYQIRTRVDGAARLNVDVHLRSSREFNDTAFYDPPTDTWKRLTDTNYDENEWPWHSSTFVFEGDVSAVLVNDINGSYARISSGYGADGRAVGRMPKAQLRPRLKQPALMRYDSGRLVNQEANGSVVNVLVGEPQRVDDGGLLGAADAPFSIVVAHQDYQFDSSRLFFFQDSKRGWFVLPHREWQVNGSFTTVMPSDPATHPYRVRYTFAPFFHPYATMLRRELDKRGLEGVFDRQVQVAPKVVPPGNSFSFKTEYAPRPLVTAVTDGDVLDFSYGGAYSQYNWELFFHGPLLVADRLRRNQRFEEALRWFHFIFDPTTASTDPQPKRYWVTKPFYDFNDADYQEQRITRLLELVNQRSPAHEAQVLDWRNNPFQPHRVARLRPVAYQRTVVMKYLDNLLEWGDNLFRRDTIESMNEATQLYILAAELLGSRPIRVTAPQRAGDKTYLALKPDLDAFSNAMAEVENTLGQPSQPGPVDPSAPPLPPPEAFYFCIPHNEKLVGYWDTVADRLFKIRHCMNIEGRVRSLPLFEPPIDPALLVKAAAAGVDISSVLSDVGGELPQYRFPHVVQRAQILANEVRQLGSAMLSALEKRDAEAVAALRATHEVSMHTSMKDARDQQIAEAEVAIEALERSRKIVETRLQHYEGLEYMNTAEKIAAGLSIASLTAEAAIALGYVLAGGLKLIPSFVVGASGFGGSPHAVVEPVSGDRIGDAAEAAVKTLSALSRAAEKGAGLASTYASYDRRSEEWELQKSMARAELESIDKQTEGARLRLAVAQAEKRALEVQLDNARAVDDFMRAKYTGTELYDWTLSQLSSVYFQAYQLAYDLAKRAERSFRYDLAIDDSDYIRFGYWDTLRKGLLAGEKLVLDLHKLETAHMERNRRELELVKHVSLAEVAPAALVGLRATGSCVVDLPELLFDMDYPGHYMRRIKTASLTILCVTGPYTGIHCTLTLLSNSTRAASVVTQDGYARTGPEDVRFRDQRAAVQSIATSHGQDDGGMFQFDFRDERYFPFEGAGTISRWRIDLPKDDNHFDFDTISDVVLHLRYTARVGGEAMATAARDVVRETLPKRGAVLLDLQHDFPNQWHAFLRPTIEGADQDLSITLGPEHLPFFARSKTPTVTKVQLVGEMKDDVAYEVAGDPVSPAGTLPFTRTGTLGEAHSLEAAAPAAGWPFGAWTLRIRRAGTADFRSLAPDEIRQLYLIVEYKLDA